MKKRLSGTLILGAAALAYLLSGETPPLIQEAPTEAGGEQAIPQSYARGVSMREFDPEGVLRDRTDADELRRYPQQQLVELIQLLQHCYNSMVMTVLLSRRHPTSSSDSRWITTRLSRVRTYRVLLDLEF